jgi:hypothetical protein
MGILARPGEDDLDNPLESGERLRVSAAWLPQPIEGQVNTSLWRGDPAVFFFEADDGQVYVIERNDPGLRVELVDAQ